MTIFVNLSQNTTINSSGFFGRGPVAAFLFGAPNHGSAFSLFFDQVRMFTLGTLFGDGLIPHREGAAGIVAAAEEDFPFPRPPFHDHAAAAFLGTSDPGLDRLGEFTGRIIGAGQKSSEFPILYDHWTAA